MRLDRPSLRIVVYILSLCFALKTKAIYSVMETGDLLSEGEYRANVETQFISDNDRGLNIMGRFDSWLNTDSNLRAVMGSGTTHFYAGGFFKWVPFPDISGQPAIGLSTGVIYARFDDVDEISLRLIPLISKKISTEVGDMKPYASIPIGLASRDGDRKIPVHLAGGLEWKTSQWDNIIFIGEFGVNIDQAFSYFSLGINYLWNTNN